MYDNSNRYAMFKEKQIRMAKLLKDSSEVINILNMNQSRENLQKLSEKINNDSFKIQVVGTFKNGKSTFINSFLGSEILPAYATPCTAVINEVKYGETKKAVLYFKDPLPDQLPAGIPSVTLTHMRKYGMKNIPPIEIAYDEIDDYAVIPMGKDPKEMLMESPYEKIELFWPLDLLKNGVEIIDSPGLNEHATRTKVAMEYLAKADAVIFVLTALALCSEEEMKFIENSLRKQGFEDVYYLVNRFDLLHGDKDKERTKQYAKIKLASQTNFGESGIFFVSALNALEGKENNNEQQYLGSGMQEFEKTISEFLVTQKGKAKLSQPARELKRILNEEALFKILPQQKSMLDSSLDEVKNRYEQAKPKLAQLTTKKTQMRERINLLIEQMMPEIRRYINNYYTDLNTNLPIWVQQYEQTTTVRMLHVKEDANDLIVEISNFLKNKIEEEQSIWLENTMQPLVADKVQGMLASIEQNMESFFIELDKIRINISGGNAADVESVPMWQRVAAAGGGLLIGDFGVAALGGVTGLSKDFVKGILLQLGSYIGLALFGLLNPVTIIAVIGISLFRGGKGISDNAAKKVKEEITNTTLKSINETAFDNVEKMIGDIKKKITELGNIVVDSMDTEINEIQVQINDIIAQMEKGQANIDLKKKELTKCEESIKVLIASLDDLIFQLIEK